MFTSRGRKNVTGAAVEATVTSDAVCEMTPTEATGPPAESLGLSADGDGKASANPREHAPTLATVGEDRAHAEQLRQRRPRRSRLFEPGSFWAAVGVIALTLSIVGAWIGINAATPSPATTTRPGQRLALTSPAAERPLAFTPGPGWTIVPTGQTNRFVIKNDRATVRVELEKHGKVNDLSNYTRRKARQLELLSSIQVTDTSHFHSASGFSGIRGRAISHSRQGELLVLGKDSTAVTVLVLGEPGWSASHQAEITAMVDSMRWNS